MSNKCGICLLQIKDAKGPQCYKCSKHFHVGCAFSPPDKFNKLNTAAKLSWNCDNCNQKKKKKVEGVLKTHTSVNLTTCSNRLLDTISEASSTETPPSMEKKSSSMFSEEMLRNLIREELSTVLQHFVDENINKQLNIIKRELEEFKSSLSFINLQYEEIKSDYQTKMNTLHNLTTENETLRETIQNMTSRLNQVEQLSRSSNLEIQCVPEHKNENILTMVTQLSKVVKCPIVENDIHYCARISKINKDSARPRSILVKLNSPRTRDSLLAAVIKYNKNNKTKLQSSDIGIGGDKDTPIFVIEHLSPENKLLHAAARLRAKELNYRYTWVRGGKIFLRKEPLSECILVKNINTLKALS
ncbi:unnamed protein product [Colias eurytheme]|nr:unnamed protein product [Colias eurytheme]